MMTPAQAQKAANEVKAEIQKHQEAILKLENQYAGFMRIVHGDDLHDTHNQRMMEQALEREAYFAWYWSDAGKAERAAAEQAEQRQREQSQQPALSGDRQKADKVLSELEPLRQRQQKH